MRPLGSPNGEQGAVLVTVAIALPVLILLASFAIDVGNWFVHARHLQTQADAGALAAAGDFRYPCDNAKIEQRAEEYGGAESGGYNHQIGGTELSHVHFALNSSTYPEQSGKVDPTVVAEPPCQAGMIDVKLTESDLPPFFSVAGIVPFINAHARVQIFSKSFLSGTLPVAVPDTNPHSARATFIDEGTKEVLATRQLTRDGTAGGLAIWDNAGAPLPVTLGEHEQIGVRVALGGGTATGCGEPLVECFEAGSASGLLYVRGYSMAGSGAQPVAPLARSVELFGEGGCSNPYFTLGGCNMGVRAKVDFGSCEKIAGVGAKLTAVVGGAPSTMTLVGCPAGTSTSEWRTSGTPFPIGVGAGPVAVSLEWTETKGKEAGNECTEKNGNKCKGSFGTVQRAFSASQARSGPILLAQLSEHGVSGADSLERCSSVQASCTHELVATIGVKENLQENATSAKQAPVTLRVFHEAVNNPSQNQSLDCDPALPNLREEIAEGCSPKYKVNEGTVCPSPSQLWASPEPWECAAIQTGGAVNQVFQGMNLRVLESSSPSTCTHPNNWSRFPELEAGDPRIVPVFLTPFGSFGGSGNTTVPVTDFATFYVTGWAGQGGGSTSQSICPTDDPAEAGTIVGHFIKYVQALNEGEASEEKCEFSSPTPCVAVLTE